ncbi:hypothetical protein RJ639_039641 [Escallonia herrerae]|uniref:Pentatricopeptide repeat-containing protein n=1 Tax=Escallonia herrerae TaxID=1293975 RepID=A0AA89B5F4_9ASTE|nr:hypothetical protein RJ639_039641 [Escallonia herrerae]
MLMATQVHLVKFSTTCCLSKSTIPTTNCSGTPRGVLLVNWSPSLPSESTSSSRIMMRDRSKNRKPLQKGRNLSIEAIQTVQALKRAIKTHDNSLVHHVFDSNFRRLLKLDMMAVLRELLRQQQCLLALKGFEEMRKEYWYKAQVSLYADIISVLGSNGLFEQVQLLVMDLKSESSLEPDIKGFNALLNTLMSFKMTGLAIECFYLMKLVGCEPDRLTFRILIKGLESDGETSLSATLRQEAQRYYGQSLEFLEEEEEEMALS